VVKVEGGAVSNLQATFAENWLQGRGELISGGGYFRKEARNSEELALVVTSTPTIGGSTRARILFQLLISSAQHSIHINTPYFLPDKSLTAELVCAIQERQVEVKIVVPNKKSDHLLTRSASRRGYGPLLKAGAEILEYKPSMIHAKILIVHGLWSVVGSTNLDYRSFGINDEVNLAVRGKGMADRLERDFQMDAAAGRKLSYTEWASRPGTERVLELLGWLFARQQRGANAAKSRHVQRAQVQGIGRQDRRTQGGRSGAIAGCRRGRAAGGAGRAGRCGEVRPGAHHSGPDGWV